MANNTGSGLQHRFRFTTQVQVYNTGDNVWIDILNMEGLKDKNMCETNRITSDTGVAELSYFHMYL